MAPMEIISEEISVRDCGSWCYSANVRGVPEGRAIRALARVHRVDFHGKRPWNLDAVGFWRASATEQSPRHPGVVFVLWGGYGVPCPFKRGEHISRFEIGDFYAVGR